MQFTATLGYSASGQVKLEGSAGGDGQDERTAFTRVLLRVFESTGSAHGADFTEFGADAPIPVRIERRRSLPAGAAVRIEILVGSTGPAAPVAYTLFDASGTELDSAEGYSGQTLALSFTPEGTAQEDVPETVETAPIPEASELESEPAGDYLPDQPGQ